MEILKIDCMDDTVNGQSYSKQEIDDITNSLYSQVSQVATSLTSQSNSGSSAIYASRRFPDVSDAISSNVMSDYMEFVNNFDNMVVDILGKDEIISHTREYIEDLPNKIVNQFCKELCQILLDEYAKPSESWDAGSNHIVTKIGSTNGQAIRGIRVYNPWHTIARMFDIGVITAEDLGVSEEEFNEHISWYKIKKK